LTPYARIRLQVWREGSGGYLPENEGTAWLAEIYPLDTHPWRDGTGPGLRIGMYPHIALSYSPLSAVKSCSALPYILAAKYASQQDWDDALLRSTDGSLAESSNSNLFVLRGNTLLTPPLTSGCLPGTVREAVLAAAANLGLEAWESPIGTDELDQADEVFLTNAIRGLRPVAEVVGTQFHAHAFPLTQKLQGILRQDAFAGDSTA
jgi:branched-chain amino acid aminotransferase